MKTTRAGRTVGGLLLLTALLSCGRGPAGTGPTPDGQDRTSPGMAFPDGTLAIPPLPVPWVPDPRQPDEEPGLELRLRSGTPGADAPGGAAAAAAGMPQPLTPERTAALLARLPALPVQPTEAPFRFPAASPPPPRTGRIQLATFPPTEELPGPQPDAPPPAPEPLRVLRVTPEGEAQLIPHVTITFSEPMVPLTTVAQAEAAAPPARLTPQPPGRWMWVDTRTLRFQPEARLPMATRFTLEVPAGIRSATGQPLAQPARFSFATPAPRATGAHPAIHPEDSDDRYASARFGNVRGESRSVRLEPVIVIAFDQLVDATTVLRTARLRADGREVPIRLATAAELAADTTAARVADGLQERRWVALRPVRPLPRDADVRVTLLPGTASAEGPRGTEQPQELRFRTYGPLRIARHGCWGEQCTVGMPWSIALTNPVDPATWSPAAIVVEPELRDMAVTLSGYQLQITGDARPNTRYRVTIQGDVRDHFGQGLEGPRSVTFDIRPPEPAVALPGAPMIVLDPEGPPRVAVRTWGMPSLRVRIYRVTPEDWPAWGDSLQRWQRNQEGTLTPPGQLVDSRTIEMPGRGQEFAETHIDVSPALSGRFGHAILVVEPGTRLPFGLDRLRRPLGAYAWVQATELGLAAAVDAQELFVWASSLRTGAAAGGVELTTLPGSRRTRTAADGTARFELTSSGEAAVVARLGEDAALLPSAEWPSPGRDGGWTARPQLSELRWYTFTDRGLYRPGETVHLKGWIRRLPGSRSVEPAVPADVGSIAFNVRGPRNEQLAEGTMVPGDLGGFHTVVELPESLNLGHAGFELRAAGGRDQNAQSYHSVQVQEFRRPDYEVRVTADPGPHVVGGVVDVALNASYYAGGGLAGAALEWRVRSRAGQYQPPGWERWHFGRAPWWPHMGGSDREHVLHAATDASGAHQLLIDLLSAEPPFPAAVRAEAQVHDLTRQVGSGGVDLLVHPAAVAVGMRLDRGWLRPGAEASAQLVVVDHDGAAVAGRGVVLSVVRVTGNVWGGRAGSAEPEEPRELCRLTSAAEPLACAFTMDSAGTHRLRAEVTDAAGRVSRTEMMLHVGGPSGPPDPQRPPGTFDIIADRAEYQPGDTARLLVQAPFHPAEALATVRGAGVLSTQRLLVTSDAHELHVPITDAHLGGIRVRVDLVGGDGTRYGHGEVALEVPPRRRALDVQVSPKQAVALPGGTTTLDVTVHDAAGRPVAGAEVALWMVDEAILALGGFSLADPLDVFYARRHGYVQDQHSRRWVLHWPRSAGPGTLSGSLVGERGSGLAGAVVRVVGTDITATAAFDGSFTLRGVPAGEVLLEVTTPDGRVARRTLTVPPEGLHAGTVVFGAEGISVAETLQDQRGVAAVAAAPPPPPPAPQMARLEMDALVVTGSEMRGADVVDVRTDFAPLAVFEPSLRTDAAGRVQLQVRLPESLTRYRVMAVAVAGADRFGTGESAVTARKELLVRILAPRFLHQGDRIELPVLVQNTGSAELPVELAVRGAGLEFTAVRGQQVLLPPGARAELRFEAAAPRAGTAHVQALAVAGNLDDAAAIALPVLTPATVEAFAIHGSTDDGAAIVLPLARPEGVIEGYGGLEVSLTSTAVHSLTDAVLYLHTYPFRGTEHIASRVLAVAALRDVLREFNAEGLPSSDSLALATQQDIADLVTRQLGDGGWSFWPGFQRTDPFVSIHVAHALQRAREKGFEVPAATLERAARFLGGVESHTARWPLPARQGALAYALFVRHRLGDRDAVPAARRMAAAAPTRVGGELPIEAAAWLLHVLAGDVSAQAEADALRRAIMNRLVETAGTATFAERYEDAAHLLLHSRRRTDAVVLEALIAANADDDVVIKLAQSLLAHRVAGRWAGTQENVWVLLALDRYFQAYEATTPAFEARAWLGERFAGGREFQGRTTDRQEIRLPMPELIRADAPELVIARAGEGRLYYRAGLRYAPADPRVPATDRGFLVSRRYEALDDPADVRRDADGTWHVRAGARVRVTLTMVAPSVRYHVALVDPMPAGFEPLNPGLQGTGFTDEAPLPTRVRPGMPGAPPPPPPPPGADVAAGRPGLPAPWTPRWFEHQNLRDDRAEAFAAYLQAGSWEYSYLARATTPGTFVVPPPRAEMMYEPETFGRGEGAVVIIGGNDR